MGTTSTTILEIGMTIDPANRKFVTHLYDKREAFNFPIVKFPHMSSNIHSKTVYNTFTAEVIRYYRVCNDLPHFLIAVRHVFKSMVKQKCKIHRLIKLLYKILHKKDMHTKFKINRDVDVLRSVLPHYLKN